MNSQGAVLLPALRDVDFGKDSVASRFSQPHNPLLNLHLNPEEVKVPEIKPDAEDQLNFESNKIEALPLLQSVDDDHLN